MILNTVEDDPVERPIAIDTQPPTRSTASTSPRPYLVSGRGVAPLIGALTGVLVVSILMSVSIGAVSIPLGDVARVIGSRFAPWFVASLDQPVRERIVWDLRVPRALLAAGVGAGLAVAGATLQVVVRNPLADPYVLGASSGASLGAVVLVTMTGAVSAAAMTLGSFAGALAASLAVLMLARRSGQLSPTRLLLAGVALSYMLLSMTTFFQIRLSPQQLQAVLFWFLGSVAGADWGDLPVLGGLVIVATAALMVQARGLDCLMAGEESAFALGLDVHRFRLKLLVVAALLTGAAIAVSGGILFVGLVVPHIARLVVGPAHGRMIPVTALIGAVFLVWVDVLARTLASPTELPLGIITGVVGGPFFLWLLRRRNSLARVG